VACSGQIWSAFLAGHPDARRRCCSLTSSRYARSARFVPRVPRGGIRSRYDQDRPLVSRLRSRATIGRRCISERGVARRLLAPALRPPPPSLAFLCRRELRADHAAVVARAGRAWRAERIISPAAVGADRTSETRCQPPERIRLLNVRGSDVLPREVVPASMAAASLVSCWLPFGQSLRVQPRRALVETATALVRLGRFAA
jgi:hypothetical protein